MDTATHLWVITICTTSAAAVAIGLIRIGPVWDTAADNHMGELSLKFKRLSLSEDRLRVFLRIWGVALIASVALLGYVAHKPPLAAFAAFLVYVAPRYVLDHLIRRRSRLLRDQLVGAAVALANAVKAGLSIAQGLETVSAEAPQPLKTELQRIVFEYQRGRPLKEAIEALRVRLELEEFNLFALAIEATLERGGRLNEALERICSSLREKQRLERKLTACTAAGRQTVITLALFPIGMVLILSLIDHEYYRVLFDTFSGQVLFALACGLVYCGGRWAWKIVNFEF
ncbi:MAG: hypothetical protein GXX96_37720 [Planctomycetaceae bacterium]|nr:hypothetical protein [Planctomycetaceae bacterium]